MDLIQEFSQERGIALDDFQLQACKALLDGCSVLVAAPTGSGKTLVADFAAYSSQSHNTHVIYTTPIKALSNQKFNEFCELYGENNVGLATGDRSIRPHARIRIMTTEVLRNIIYSHPESLENVSHVVLDEVHYISDRSRGAVWEEVIIQLPLEIDLVCLSATVSNAEEVAQWLTTVRGSTQAIIHETRPIPLSYWFSFRRRRQGISVLPLLSHGEPEEITVHPDLYKALRPRSRDHRKETILSPRRLDLIDYLEMHAMLPAIYFIFSRAACDDAVHECFNSHARLTSHEERKQIREICHRHLDGLSNEEFDALDYDIVVHAMENGFAPHHAGLIPPLREAVEEAFVLGLIKVVFATETLAVGVNMPAKSVVIEKLTKFNGDHHDMITPGEFTQLTGRAGRRGIDVAGHAIVQWNRFIDFEQAAALASTRSYALKSSFRPTYNMAANLISTYTPMHARHILNLSLAQFQADDAVVALERNLESKRIRMDKIRAGYSDTDRQFAARVHKAKRASEKKIAASKKKALHSAFADSLHAGDVVDGFKYLGVCVVISKDKPRNTPRIRVLDTNARIHIVEVPQIDPDAQCIGRIDLPTPIAPRTKHFRISTAIALKKAITQYSPKKRSRSLSTVEKHTHDDLIDEYISAERDIARLTRRVQSRGQSLARQFERILELLEALDYVNGWELTNRGEILSQINAECDLAITHHICELTFHDLSVPEFVALLSCFVFESRGDADSRINRFPTKNLADIIGETDNFVALLNTMERDAGLKESRGLDYGMMYPSYEWARGKSLDNILGNRDIAGGDFVRIMKSILDLLKQIETSGVDQQLQDLCRQAHAACFRDIIELSS